MSVSWIFSPGRMPTMRCGRSGAMCLARSVIFMLGILGTKISPPFISDRHDSTKRSEEHQSELQSIMRSSYADFCLKKKDLSYIQVYHTTDTHSSNTVDCHTDN